MLAQNFKSAADLALTEKQRDALIKVLVLLETGKLRHVGVDGHATFDRSKFDGFFNMSTWVAATKSCGTVACIGGTAELIAGEHLFSYRDADDRLRELFTPCDINWYTITTQQASVALRSYLTSGHANWPQAIQKGE